MNLAERSHTDFRWLLKQPLSSISSTTKICYIYLVDCALHSEYIETYSCKIKMSEIGEAIAVSTRAARKAIKALSDLKLISISPKSGEKNMYTLLQHEWM
jgi:hypothetical protein